MAMPLSAVTEWAHWQGRPPQVSGRARTRSDVRTPEALCAHGALALGDLHASVLFAGRFPEGPGMHTYRRRGARVAIQYCCTMAAGSDALPGRNSRGISPDEKPQYAQSWMDG